MKVEFHLPFVKNRCLWSSIKFVTASRVIEFGRRVELTLKGSLSSQTSIPRKGTRFVLCIDNRDSEDLEKRKIYQVLPDDDAKQEGYLRIIDESGEDYLYPESYFILVQLPLKAQEALQTVG